MNRILMMVLKNIYRVPGAWFKLCHYAKHTEKYPEKEKFDHIQMVMQWAVKTGNIDLQVFGAEHTCQDQGFVIYSNHQGMFDVVALAATSQTPLAAVYKKELTGVPFLQQVFDCTKSLPMDREDVRQSLTVIQAVTREVLAGRNYVIFPEGTRSRNGNVMGDFHSGSFRCALKSKCPVIPVCFIDSYKVLDEKGSKPVRVQLHYLEPIFYEEYKDMKTGELAELVHSRIQAAIDACA